MRTLLDLLKERESFDAKWSEVCAQIDALHNSFDPSRARVAEIDREIGAALGRESVYPTFVFSGTHLYDVTKHGDSVFIRVARGGITDASRVEIPDEAPTPPTSGGSAP